MSLKNFFENAKRNSEKHTQWVDKEREFWRTMGKQQSPLYGADMEGTLFDSSLSSSHLGLQEWSFDTGLNDILRMLPYKVPGVNTPMIYVGEWRAMFPFHVEDLDLYSINYLHTGAEKSWYSIAPGGRARFENLAESHYADDHRVCRKYLRHKTKIFSPMKLRDCGMKFDTVVQRAGEFVVTFPGAYHAGFNHDFNIAEATNFATPRWLELGRNATRCICRPHSVFINMDELETLYRRKCQMKKFSFKKLPSATNNSTPDNPTSTPRACARKVIDLTSDKSMVETERPTEKLLLRCECGEVRPVRLEERAELTLWPVGEARLKLVAQRAFAPNLSLGSGSSFLLRCTQCQFFVHRHCARPATENDYTCYMCRRIDRYAVSADTLVAVSARADEPTGQRASSLKSLQFGTSQSSVDSVSYGIERNPDHAAKAHRCAKAVQIEDSAEEDEEEPAVTRSRSRSLQVEDQRDEKRGQSHHEKNRTPDSQDRKHRNREGEHKKTKKHKRSHSRSGGDGSSSEAAILIDVPAPKRHRSSHRDKISKHRHECEQVSIYYEAPYFVTLLLNVAPAHTGKERSANIWIRV